MNQPSSRLILIPFACLACGTTASTEIGADAGLAIDASEAPDASLRCPDPTVVLPTEWRPILEVATGGIENLGSGAYYVDGSAGGIPNAPDNPFLYLRFSAPDSETPGLEVVDITDVDARSDVRWDLAVKRMVVLTNGGDSGSAGHVVAVVAAASLDEVREIPTSASFASDQWADDDCNYSSGFIGEPTTAIGTWYDYDTSTSQLAPLDIVYIIARQDGSAFALEFETYYYEDFGSAHYVMAFEEI